MEINAPEEIVAGVVLAAKPMGSATCSWSAMSARLKPMLAQQNCATDRCEIVHAPGSDRHGRRIRRQALRRSDGFHVARRRGQSRTRRKSADAVVSAGNSGAFLAIALVRASARIRRRCPARNRGRLPGKTRAPSIVLDSGANVDCRPEWLAQFGVMGSAYARAALGIEQSKSRHHFQR